MKLKALVVLGISGALAWSQAPPAAPAAKPTTPAAAPAAKPTAPAAKPAAAPAKDAAAPKAATPKAAVPKPAAAPKSSPVDQVIELVKNGVSDSLIIRTLKTQNKPVALTPADLGKLNNAKVSEAVIEVLMDPTATPAAAAAAAPARTPEAAPAAPVTPAQPVASTSTPATATPAVVTPAQKPRVMVEEFDYSAVATVVQQVFQTNVNIGKGIRAMLTKRVAEQGKLVVVERAKINTLTKEQDFAASNRVKQGSGSRIGRISGANLMLAGDIIIFGRDDKQMKVKGGGIFGRVGGAIGAATREDKAVVAINYRLVDAETSEVVATGEARGESSRKSKGIGGIAGAFGKGVAGVEVDMTSSGFAETIIGEATMDCVNKLAAILTEQTLGMKPTVREVEALIADVNGNSLTISAGTGDGVNQGEIFEVHKILREVKDPVTKEVLDRVTEKVGEMTITAVRDRVSVGNYTGAAPQVGFIARKKI